MKVVIAGAGEVGTHLARMFSDEYHDIVLIDDSPEKLSNISSEVDLLTVNGSAHSFEDLKLAGVAKADLFIAVTPSEERNILACTIATFLGAVRTIARINNAEYLKPEHRLKLETLGVDELIYPEILAAKEIVASLKQTGTRQLIEFSQGKLLLLGIKVRENAPILNKTFEQLTGENKDILVVAISRKGRTIIPGGSDYVADGDVVFFVTTRAEQHRVFELTAKKTFEVKNIMFLGGSRIAQKTMERLGPQYNIKVIEQDIERCEQIAAKFDNVLVINGDCRNIRLLQDEGLELMDAVVATTDNSETNILVSNLAKTMGVKRTVAEVENLGYTRIAENMNIGTVINKKIISVSYIYRFTINANISKVKCLTTTDAEVFEFIAGEKSKITQKPLMDIEFPAEAKIGGIIRGDKAYVAHGNTHIRAGDRVVVFTLPAVTRKLEKIFK